MRIDLEQFLALTMILGTAGAVGVAAYIARADEPELAPVEALADDEPTEAPASDAAPPAPAPPAPPTVAEPEGPPPLPEEPDPDFETDPGLDGVAAPQVEGAW